MKISIKTFLVPALSLLSAVDYSCAQAPTCTSATQRICNGPTSFVPCTATGPVTECSVLDQDRAACYGVGVPSAICYSAPCASGPGNYPITNAPNAYYTCVGAPATYSSSQTCPAGVNYNVGARACDVLTTTTTLPTTPVAITTIPPTTTAPPPLCTGQQRVVDPTSCNHFYVCAGATSGLGTRTKCPFSMRYDVASRSCRSRYFTYCGTRPDLALKVVSYRERQQPDDGDLYDM